MGLRSPFIRPFLVASLANACISEKKIARPVEFALPLQRIKREFSYGFFGSSGLSHPKEILLCPIFLLLLLFRLSAFLQMTPSSLHLRNHLNHGFLQMCLRVGNHL